jgi:hypothetical protein
MFEIFFAFIPSIAKPILGKEDKKNILIAENDWVAAILYRDGGPGVGLKRVPFDEWAADG